MPTLLLVMLLCLSALTPVVQPFEDPRDVGPQPDLTAAEPQVREKIERIRRQLEAEPLEAERWGAYAIVLDVHGYVHDAGVTYERARELAPGDHRWPHLQAMLVRESEPEAAVALFTEAIRLDPEYVAAYVHLGTLHEMFGRPDQASKLYDEARLRDPDNVSARLRTGQMALQRDQIQRALTELSAAYELAPNDRAVLSALARALFRAGRPDDARRAAEAAVHAESHVVRDPLYQRTRAEAVTVAAMIARGRSFRDASRFDEALGELHRALELDPDHPQIRRLIISVHLERRDVRAAVEAYEAALRESPDDPTLVRGFAIALSALGQYQESVDHLSRLHQARPDDLDVANELAWQLAVCPDASVRDAPAAIRLAEHVVTIEPTPSSLDTLAAAYAADSRFADAIRTMQRAIEALGPAAPERYRDRLELYMAGRPYRAPVEAGLP